MGTAVPASGMSSERTDTTLKPGRGAHGTTRASQSGTALRAHSVCFIAGTRYPRPLTPTQAKKFEGLARQNRILVVAFSSSLRPRAFVQSATFFLLPGVPIRHLRYLLLFLVGPVLGLWCVARHGAQVLVAQSPYEGCVGAWVKLTARALMRRRVALVVESHGNFEDDPSLQRRGGGVARYAALMRSAARTAFANADAFRAISSSTEDQIRRLGGSRPLVRFPTWSDVDVFLQAGRHRTAVGTGVLYTGVLIPRKGVHHLIAAFATVARRSPGTRLTLIGDAPDAGYKAELERLVGRLGLEDTVTFAAPVPQSELAERMAGARVLVLPSLSEGLGRVVFEAMAAGTPVIGSAVGGIPDMIQDGVNGFLIGPADEARLAQCLTTVLDDAALSARLGARARELAETTLSTAKYFAEYRRLFDLALASTRHSTGGPS